MSLSTRARRGLVGALTLALAGGVLAAVTATAGAAERSVDDVQFRWGLSNESNNSAFAPGTFNYFSAGKLGNPGAGGQTIPASTATTPRDGSTWSNGEPAGWSATDGEVTIEKKQTDGSYSPTTFAGTSTSASGGSLGGPTVQTFSDHQVVIDSGTGTIDPEENTADISWDGDFSIIYYSGMSFFYVSDPQLEVQPDGTGTVTATLSGYGSDMDDMEQWNELAPEEVTLANLTDVDVTDTGLTVTPDYLGVEYDHGDNQAQTPKTDANAAYWGSFPQSFVDFTQKVGAGPYWYSSGGAVDRNKPTLPLEINIPADTEPEPVATSTKLTTKGSTYGKRGSLTVSVAGATTGTVKVAGGGWTKTLTLKNGKATNATPVNWRPGTRTLTATYQGDGTYAASSGKATHKVTKGKPSVNRVGKAKRPTRKKSGWTKVRITSSGPAKATGHVRAVLVRGKKTYLGPRVKLNSKGEVNKLGIRKAPKGTYRLEIRYSGNGNLTKATGAKGSITIR